MAPLLNSLIVIPTNPNTLVLIANPLYVSGNIVNTSLSSNVTIIPAIAIYLINLNLIKLKNLSLNLNLSTLNLDIFLENIISLPNNYLIPLLLYPIYPNLLSLISVILLTLFVLLLLSISLLASLPEKLLSYLKMFSLFLPLIKLFSTILF